MRGFRHNIMPAVAQILGAVEAPMANPLAAEIWAR